jgi:uncharacterized protein YxjI
MRYLMRQHPAWHERYRSGTDFPIEDGEGRLPFRVTREEPGRQAVFLLRDSQDAPLSSLRFRIDERSASCEIVQAGRTAQVVRNDGTGRRIRFRIYLADAGVLAAQGNIGRDEYVVRHGLRRLATVSKKGSPEQGTFGVEISSGTDVVLLLSIVLAIGIMTGSQPDRPDGEEGQIRAEPPVRST